MGPIKQPAYPVRHVERQTRFINTFSNWNNIAINQQFKRRRGTNAGINAIKGDSYTDIVSDWCLVVLHDWLTPLPTIYVAMISVSWLYSRCEHGLSQRSAAGRRPWTGSAERTGADVADQSQPPPRMLGKIIYTFSTTRWE